MPRRNHLSISKKSTVSMYPELIQGRNIVVEQEEVGGEVLELAPFLLPLVALAPSGNPEVPLLDAYAGCRAPEVPPPPRQHARLHDLRGREKGHDGVEEAVRQVA